MPLGLEKALRLSSRTLAWWDGHPVFRKFARAVWAELAEMERAGRHPVAINRIRHVLVKRRPTSTGWCRGCPCRKWRGPEFPCFVWHTIHCEAPSFFRVQPELGRPLSPP
ncbi:MAG: hypothetical protein JO281_23040 [Pseudonocardiales bacterium]|nr:hypothetical protein [Pseudonocardiales bacterium]MBV9164351.1 hypothetical protein [Pseudonocardiales bacterium]